MAAAGSIFCQDRSRDRLRAPVAPALLHDAGEEPDPHLVIERGGRGRVELRMLWFEHVPEFAGEGRHRLLTTPRVLSGVVIDDDQIPKAVSLQPGEPPGVAEAAARL
jgi:hypothetical protein